MAKRPKSGGLVYSTEGGRFCPGCRRPQADCVCNAGKGRQQGIAGDGIVRLSRETKGRKGSGVTLITGLTLSGDALARLAKTLKSRCGVGGTVRDGVIELQGDQRTLLRSLLEAEGYKVKIAGG